MRKHTILIAIILVGFVAAITTMATAGEKEHKGKAAVCTAKQASVETAEKKVCTEAKEEEIPLAKVPAKVTEAAQKKVPGIKLTEAEVETTKKGKVYEVEGTADGKEYEIEITAEGKVMNVETDDDDDDDNDDDDDDNDDDD